MSFATHQRIDPAPYLALVHDRFGLPLRLFDGYDLYRATSKTLYLVPAVLPVEPPPLFAGFAFLRDQTRYCKLTTAAAIAYAPHATRNVARLNPQQARALPDRETFAFVPDATCTGTRFMLVLPGPLPLGLAFYSPQRGTPPSLFPPPSSGAPPPTTLMPAPRP